MHKSTVHLLLIFAFSFGLLMPGAVGVRVANAFGHGGCSCLCPSCGEQCYLDISEGKEKRHSWEVETKQVCIPPVHFSLKCCAVPDEQLMCKPARTRTVRVLKKKEYECPKCKYEWKQFEVEEAEQAESAAPESKESKPDEKAASTEPPIQNENEYEYVYEYEPVESELAPVVDGENVDPYLPTESVPGDSWPGDPAPSSPIELPGAIDGTKVPTSPSTSSFKPPFRFPQLMTTLNASSPKKSRTRKALTAGRANRNARR